ncbi:hypothetical protein [Marinilabilia rubra]|uniref:Uncharacterized protein n=1 Tax=Marinilabilia rubra TaxID=2162893 RepID=A0A2U2B9D1_9BACT|nr:hypothetical protein [Marinilabilia rubra]PWD99654.1 hypothetical protein DDZ16_09415 [Marinilabilia rubra]
MFQGIAEQITEATKEVRQQKVLRNYVETLEKQEKVNHRLKKKAESNLSKTSIPQVSSSKVIKSISLRSLFFNVFKKQENEKDSARSNFIRNILTSTHIDHCTAVYTKEITANKSKLKPGREVTSLELLIKKIKNSTKDKYYSHDVLSMLQFIDRLSQAKAKSIELERALNVGQTAEKHLQTTIKNLTQEENWGSWELVASKKADYNQIPPSEIDKALDQMPLASAYIECFCILALPFLENRNLVLHGDNLQGLFNAFIENTIKDWIYADKIKATLSRSKQVMNSVKVIIHGLENIYEQNKSEISLLEIETSKRIEETGKQVEKRLNEKF